MKDIDISAEEYTEYLDNLLCGRKAECAGLVEELIDRGMGMYDIYLKLFQPSLYDVGLLWEQNRISVASEHLATAVTERLFSLVYPMIFRTERVGKQAVVTCVANELHQIGAKMVADVFELNGWDTRFLGPNTPSDDLLDLLGREEPDLLGISLSIYFNLPQLIDLINRVRERFPRLEIVVGGQAFQWGGVEVLYEYPGVSYLPSLRDLESLIQTESANA
ncbi:MAG: cobalamin-dependent protein [Spirochaetia bacterium]